MSDITLHEALTEYADECCEVLGDKWCCVNGLRYLMDSEIRRWIIEDALLWLGGKDIHCFLDGDTDNDSFCDQFPSRPLAALLEQVRAHIEAQSDE